MDIEKLIKVLYINNFCLEGLNHKVHFTSEIYINYPKLHYKVIQYLINILIN